MHIIDKAILCTEVPEDDALNLVGKDFRVQVRRSRMKSMSAVVAEFHEPSPGTIDFPIELNIDKKFFDDIAPCLITGVLGELPLGMRITDLILFADYLQIEALLTLRRASIP